MIHPADRGRVDAFRRETRELSRGFDAEFRVIWPDGSVHWLRAKGTVLVDNSGRSIRSMGVIEDISQRKQAEAALCESEERYRSLVVATSAFVLDRRRQRRVQPAAAVVGVVHRPELGAVSREWLDCRCSPG